MKAKLTDITIRNLKAPSEGRLVITDEATPCLSLRVTTGGVKSWSVQFRVRGQAQRRVTIGTYPAVALTAARARANALRDAAGVGRDLVAEEAAAVVAEEARRVAAVVRGRTVRQAVAEYVESYCKARQRRWQLTEALLVAHVLPRLGDKPLTELRRGDVVELLDDLRSKNGFGAQVNRVHATLKHMLNWAIEKEWLDANPAQPVKKRVAEAPRDRVLSNDELQAIWRAADGLTEPSRGLVRVMMLTGQRRDECRCLPWSELDLEAGLWVLPAPRAKNGREHALPLPGEVLGLLNAMPRLGEPPVFVFSTDGTRPYAGQKRLKEILDQRSGVTDWVFHDLRRTAASGMAGLGIPHEIIGRVLNHAKSDVTARHYNRHDYMVEKRAALEAWARHVLTIVWVPTDS